MVSSQLTARQKQDKTSDREWVHTVLAYLKVYVEDLSRQFMMGDEDKANHISDLVQSLGAVASQLAAGTRICVDACHKLMPNMSRCTLLRSQSIGD